MELQPAPARVVDEHGQVTYGLFAGPIRDVNLADAEVRWHGLRLPRRLVGFRLKRWQHYAIVLPDLFLGVAVVDLGFITTSWCHVVERDTGARFEHQRKGPGLAVRVARQLFDDQTFARARGYDVAVANRLEIGEHALTIVIDGAPERPPVRAELRCRHDLAAIQALDVVLPVGPNRGMYSHKVPLPLEGHVEVGGRRYSADPGSAFAILDIHQAHYPRRMFWRWATWAWRDPEGRALALNLTRNVITEDDRWHENALWCDGRIQLLGPARFDYDRARAADRPWRLASACGSVDLTFTPEGERSDATHLGLVTSVFRQPYGTFAGSVRFRGQTLPVDGAFGVCEDHESVW